MKEAWHNSASGRRSFALWGLTVSLALGAAACASAPQSNDGNPSADDAPGPSAPVAAPPFSTAGQPTGPEGIPTESEGIPTESEDIPTKTEPDTHSSGDKSPSAGGTTGAAGAPSLSGAGGHRGLDDVGTAGAGAAGGNPEDGGETPPDPANCAEAGGVCVPLGTCEHQLGTIADASDCKFDDGAAECCVPPSPQPDATTCEGRGGICTSIGGCLQSEGHDAPPEVACEGGAGAVCCVAHEVCGDADIECCSDGTVFRPACDNGEFVCPVGEPYPLGTCPR